MSNDAEDFNAKGWAIGIALVLGVIWLGLIGISICSKEAITRIGSAGDSFGVFASLFSALAFIGLLYTIQQQKVMIRQQSKDLKHSRKELKLTRKQFKKNHELEKRAKIVASRPIIECSDTYLKFHSMPDEPSMYELRVFIANDGASMNFINDIQVALDLGGVKYADLDRQYLRLSSAPLYL